jgi:geranylgeranyl diphosphate synthase type II
MGYPPNLERYRLAAEAGLREAIGRCSGPAALAEAMAYSLLAGGKRLRPVLVLATRAVFPPGGIDPMPVACALEFVHTYSLVHDDLPALDDDDYRRGRPSCHRRFGEATAILAGDALLTQAFWLLAQAFLGRADPAGPAVIEEIAGAAGSDGMVGGQVLDTIGAGTGLDRTVLEDVHRRKTGALIRAAVRCGAILGGASRDEFAALTSYAERIGMAFQVADDVLDVTAPATELGKTPGKDAVQGKTTWATLLGVDGARRHARGLVDAAVQDLEPLGDAARDLRSLAEFFVDRTW